MGQEHLQLAGKKITRQGIYNLPAESKALRLVGQTHGQIQAPTNRPGRRVGIARDRRPQSSQLQGRRVAVPTHQIQ